MTDAAASPHRTAALAADASMHDMLRIMDVASALRRGRETAESQLDLATEKQRLRERLLATAAAAGEPVTAAEVDAAIDQYFAQQHVYADPPPGWRRLAAHLWVMRAPIFWLLVLLAGLTAIGIAVAGMLSGRGEDPARPTPGVSAPAPAPASPRAEEQLASAWATFQRTLAAAENAAVDDDARGRVRAIATDGELAHASGKLGALRGAQGDLEALAARLAEEFTVAVVDRPGERSGIDRYEGGRLSGYYLIVEATAPDGRVLTRPIRNAESGRVDSVTKWGEQVPPPVWERLVADKTADGVVDERVFARKQRGRHDEVIVMPDDTGKPLRRGRQITKW